MIPSSSGVTLEVEAVGPRRPSAPCLVLAHPHPQMGGDMRHKIIDTLFRRSAEKGWGAVRFNFRGVGASTGSYDSGAGETDVLLAVLSFASKELSRSVGSIALVGSSFGSWVAAKAAAALPELGRLVLIAPPVNVTDFSVLACVKHPKHVFAAGRDEFASPEALDSFFERLSPPKTIHLLEGSDHSFTGSTVKLVRDVLRLVDER
jgi:uncharacterized protein